MWDLEFLPAPLRGEYLISTLQRVGLKFDLDYVPTELLVYCNWQRGQSCSPRIRNVLADMKVTVFNCLCVCACIILHDGLRTYMSTSEYAMHTVYVCVTVPISTHICDSH